MAVPQVASAPLPSRSAAPACPFAGRSLPAALLRGCLAGFALALALEAGRVLFGSNLHAVVPGAFYRCAQPSRALLESVIEAYGVRTVVNLRGCCDPTPWYLEECRAGAWHDLSQEDLGFSSGRLPSVPM